MSVLVWIIYDITENKLRSKVSKECKKAGLIRVQKSVFLGKLEWNRFDELGEKCRDIIDKDTDSLYIFPFCQEDFRQIKVLGQGFDKKLVNDEILAKFF
ncbi:CRISPR-associated protein [Desulfonema limicola]|uniref:CRISPR-associated endoribonuclease Cas2 n=1 Tax=Desulfonema limicola TaxID=45656 RepID=A0A975B8S5_9BACT|nr:CRISPR-associated endonuclease Cas2 [Desulfonema limicola]QTA80762.1 CRISPR-associated protein [Desulfonema limicola]